MCFFSDVACLETILVGIVNGQTSIYSGKVVAVVNAFKSFGL